MDTLSKIFRSCCACRSHPSAPPTLPQPTEPYPTPQYIYITTSAEANHHLQTVQPGAVIGLDIEAVQRPGPKLTRQQKREKLAAEIRDRASFIIDWSVVDTCLVQIATEEGHVFVINLRIMGELPSKLVRILESREIFKVGAGIFSDGQRMWDSFRVDLRSVILLGLVARLAYPTTLLVDRPFGVKPSLAVIVGHALGYVLLKEQQMSAWDAASLSDKQKDYAAIDAHASLHAFQSMRILLDNCGVPVPPAWYTHDIVGRARVRCGTNEPWVVHCPWWSADPARGFEART
ncbi:ribonuclease H-like domain-containing protein [Mycena olivaceomarginata]|nr:ribonuclease H-like domain-containing protein [Mycena olivaceomarginata]